MKKNKYAPFIAIGVVVVVCCVAFWGTIGSMLGFTPAGSPITTAAPGTSDS